MARPTDTPTPAPRGAAGEELVEHVAAALHTLMRSWRYAAPAPGTVDAAAGGPVALEPWLQATSDPHWAAQQPPAVDLATTPWHLLPADWRVRFLELGRAAADPVVEAVTAGRLPDDLQADPRYLETVGRTLRRPWIGAPRVLIDGKAILDVPPEDVLAQTAVHVYAHRLHWPRTALGAVPRYPLPELGERREITRSTGVTDERRVTLRIEGPDLDPDEITGLTGVTPVWANRRGDLNISRATGQLYLPYPDGRWHLESDAAIEPHGTSVEQHVVWLLDQLEPSAGDLAAYVVRHRLVVDFFAFYLQDQPNAEWILSTSTIQRMARLSASFSMDHYIQVTAAEPEIGPGDLDH